MTRLPLEGVTVISLEQAVAAPFASRQLADLGARVIKIERESGDFARGYDSTVDGLASYFVWLNRGKESVVLDLKSPDGLRALKVLIQSADIFIQNLAPGAVDRLGLDPETVRRENERLIYVSISGYGSKGDSYWNDKKAYDLLIQCETGFLSATGTPEIPVKAGISIADISAGMYAYSGTLTALLNRAATGEGDVVEISMLESLGEWMAQPYFFAHYGGSPPQRSGAQHASIAPYGPFAASDGQVFFGIQNEREWITFCGQVLEMPQISSDERFSSNNQRVAHREELHSLVSGVFERLTTSGVIQRLDDAGIANARLRDMHEFSAHPQLEARQRWAQIDSPVGPLRSALPPASLANAGVRLGPVPGLGEHTEKVLQEFLPPEPESR